MMLLYSGTDEVSNEYEAHCDAIMKKRSTEDSVNILPVH
jgi:hypothetical protein